MLLTTLAAWPVEPAFACSCVPRDPGPMLENSDAAFIGQVVSYVDPPMDGIWSSSDPVTYTFAVESVAKGDLSATVQVISAFSGASCGFEGGIRNGERAGILLRIGDDGNYTSGLCSTLSPDEMASVSELTKPVLVPRERPPVPKDELYQGNHDSRPSSWLISAGLGLVLVVLFGGYRVAIHRKNTPNH